MALPDFLRSLKETSFGPERIRITVGALGRHASEYPDHGAATAAQLRHLDRALEVLRRCKAALTDGDAAEGALAFEAMILSKLGRFDEAMDLARAAYQRRPTWQSACTAANACLRAGQKAQGLDLLALAARLDPGDVSALLQIGDIHLEDARWEPALAAYEEVLAKEERHAWALPSALFCRYHLAGDAASLRRLRGLARSRPDECGVDGVLEALLGSHYSAETGRRRALHLLSKLPVPRRRR